jgi:3-oxoacyl-[acyl-carrier-protein] synthase-1
MNEVVVTGLGFITSIGNNRGNVTESLRECRSGVELMPELVEANASVKLAGTIKGFSFPSIDPLDWTFPDQLSMTRAQLRTATPNVLYAIAAMDEAIADAQLSPDLLSSPDTGLYCASAGSSWLTHAVLDSVFERGAGRTSASLVISGMPNSLHLNLTSRYHIKGSSLGFSSACASSAHALGFALDQIRLGRQKRVVVVGAEDCHPCNILPFASLRALSSQSDPRLAPRAFDIAREGFVVTGGSTVLVLEDAHEAVARGVRIYGKVRGWGQASDGHDVVAPDPAGAGLARAMSLALNDAEMKPEEIDYLNAHATSTVAGDVAEIRALRTVFESSRFPQVSSTKSLTGHGLSMSGAMEAAFCCLTLTEQFYPVSANITQLDPACAGVPVITSAIEGFPQTAMSNSSGFGGSNVSLIFST